MSKLVGYYTTLQWPNKKKEYFFLTAMEDLGKSVPKDKIKPFVGNKLLPQLRG